MLATDQIANRFRAIDITFLSDELVKLFEQTSLDGNPKACQFSHTTPPRFFREPNTPLSESQ